MKTVPEEQVVSTITLQEAQADLKGIVLSPDGKLARIDSGISRAYGGTLSWLEIHGDQLTPHTVRRPPAK